MVVSGILYALWTFPTRPCGSTGAAFDTNALENERLALLAHRARLEAQVQGHDTMVTFPYLRQVSALLWGVHNLTARWTRLDLEILKLSLSEAIRASQLAAGAQMISRCIALLLTAISLAAAVHLTAVAMRRWRQEVRWHGTAWDRSRRATAMVITSRNEVLRGSTTLSLDRWNPRSLPLMLSLKPTIAGRRTKPSTKRLMQS
jgi:hypothetical protein